MIDRYIQQPGFLPLLIFLSGGGGNRFLKGNAKVVLNFSGHFMEKGSLQFDSDTF